MIYVSDEV